jgi:hypothetical protein
VRSLAAVLIVSALALGAGPAAAEGPRPGPLLALQTPAPEPYVPPGANLTAPPPEVRRRPIIKRWWFWAAVGGAVVTTVAIVLVASQSPSAPGSTLGNMEVFGGK